MILRYQPDWSHVSTKKQSITSYGAGYHHAAYLYTQQVMVDTTGITCEANYIADVETELGR